MWSDILFAGLVILLTKWKLILYVQAGMLAARLLITYSWFIVLLPVWFVLLIVTALAVGAACGVDFKGGL